ncbi:hypothetical protein L6452_00417 [Arctium lappa]|uniref:Uncharacterized protein n=1 Tax=Arctium lappa TaxID=4217 RepID=A0ACB9FF46_ARCLA|nr:hypothetical protein L6452_00417 [Arctium lappa]
MSIRVARDFCEADPLQPNPSWNQNNSSLAGFLHDLNFFIHSLHSSTIDRSIEQKPLIVVIETSKTPNILHFQF